ncbi:MAG: hypothetical protein EHM35_15835 [Planctomycetaceae bacterium]|nr:MAG: hypothetical protein EHM35_15835 [Planctomycetaceae bacterium]
MELWLGCALTAAVEAVLHWAPWPRWLGKEMQKPATYVVGMVPILVIFSAWMLVRKPSARHAIFGLHAITASAGAAVIGGYELDKKGGWLTKLRVFGGHHEPADHTR